MASYSPTADSDTSMTRPSLATSWYGLSVMRPSRTKSGMVASKSAREAGGMKSPNDRPTTASRP